MSEDIYHYECLCTRENKPVLLQWEYDKFVGAFNPDGTEFTGDVKDLITCKPIQYKMSPGFCECYWELLRRWWKKGKKF